MILVEIKALLIHHASAPNLVANDATVPSQVKARGQDARP